MKIPFELIPIIALNFVLTTALRAQDANPTTTLAETGQHGDIAALLAAKQFRAIVGHKWANDPHVSDFLLTSFSQWQANTDFGDQGYITDISSLIAANQDPKVAEALDDTVTKLAASDLTTPAATFLANLMAWMVVRDIRDAHLALSVIPPLVKNQNQQLDRVTGVLLSATVTHHPEWAADPAMEGSIEFVKTKWSNDKLSPVTLACLGDKDSFVKLATTYVFNQDLTSDDYILVAKLLDRVSYSGPGSKWDVLKDHAKDAVFQKGYWVLTIPGYPTPANMSDAASTALSPTSTIADIIAASELRGTNDGSTDVVLAREIQGMDHGKIIDAAVQVGQSSTFAVIWRVFRKLRTPADLPRLTIASQDPKLAGERAGRFEQLIRELAKDPQPKISAEPMDTTSKAVTPASVANSVPSFPTPTPDIKSEQAAPLIEPAPETNAPLVTSVSTAFAPVICTITQSAPLEVLGPDGAMTSVTQAVVGKSYQCLRVENGKAILQDENKHQFRIRSEAVSQTPSPTTQSNPQTSVTSPSGIPSTQTTGTNADPKVVLVAAPAVNGNPVDDLASISRRSDPFINSVVGLRLFSGADFWKEETDIIAKRLNVRSESTTSVERSYRRYGGTPVLGATAYSIALYGKNDGDRTHPTYLSFIFNNAGDFHGTGDLEVATMKDQKAVTAALTALLGNPATMYYGNSSDNREDVLRWDYQGTSFLLTSHNKDYVSLKIVPVSVADNHGTIAVTPRDELAALLAKRVVHAINGDVTLADIPMVDQGPHGYCVPATWERYLRYVDVPADLYELAQLGHSSSKTGTSFNSMTTGIDGYVSACHRRIESLDGDLDINRISKFIDKGLPLMWGCYVNDTVEKLTAIHTKTRASVTDWDAYLKGLRNDDDNIGGGFVGKKVDSTGQQINGHMRMIVGYNPKTLEIATTDSWGDQTKVNWIYLPTSKRISQNFIQYIDW